MPKKLDDRIGELEFRLNVILGALVVVLAGVCAMAIVYMLT
jgi:hypothetical protein